MAGKSSKRVSEQVAYELLEALVPILIRFQVTPRQLNEMSRVLLVRGLARQARLRNGRINQSQIAAATGLSRAEVKRCLDEIVAPYRNTRLLAASKADQVILGWLHDKRYCLRPGRPAALPYAGSGATFTSLVNEYGGDVPPRAMASELTRRGLVRLSANRLSLRTDALSASANAHVNMSAHLDAIRALADSIDAPVTQAGRPHVRFISVPAHDALEGGVIRSRAEDIVDGAAAALRSLKESPIVGQRPKKPASLDVRVTVVLSEVPREQKKRSAK